MESLPGLKGFGTLKGLPGLSGRSKRPKLEVPKLEETEFDLTDDVLDQLTRELGEVRLARKVLELKKQYPDGTVPELCCLEYLQRTNIPYWYQVAVFGGRVRGGLIPDFVLDKGGWGMVWNVQGNYWHRNTAEKDAATKLRLRGEQIMGLEIRSVTYLWESRIKDRASRPQVFELAAAGVEMGP